MKDEKEDFIVLQNGNELKSSEVNDESIGELTADKWKKIWATAANGVDKSGLYASVFSGDAAYTTTLKRSDIDYLSESPQDDKSKVIQIANYARTFINKNDLIGKTYDAIDNNTNTEMNLVYNSFEENRNKNVKITKAKSIIDKFNKQIGARKLIRKIVPITYAEGNYITYLKGNYSSGFTVDYYPLDICDISNYTENGQPIVLMDIEALKKRIKPDYATSDLFFADVKSVIESVYPEEVIEAFSKGAKYAKLNPMRTGVIRIGNFNRKYGVSPILRVFEPLITLEGFEKSDELNSKAKAKKIIFQKMRKELIENPDETDIMGKTIHAHNELIASWKNDTVIYTGAPWVEDLLYVEPSVESTSVETLNFQRSKIVTGLGISYLSDAGASVTGGKISVSELMKNINKISEQIEDVLEKYYEIVLVDSGVANEENVRELVPEVNVIDSEQMEWDIKKEIATLLYTTFNCSLDTTLKVLGFNAKDEAQKRKEENDNHYDEIFSPRVTSFTSSGDSDGLSKTGRPADNDSNNPEKQAVDKENRN